LFAFFLLKSLTGRVEANWPDGLYPTLTILATTPWWQAGAPRKGFVGAAIILGAVVVGLAHQTDLIRASGAPLPPRSDPTHKVRGLQDLAKQLGAAAEHLSAADGQPRFLLSARRDIVSPTNFYLQGRPAAFAMNPRATPQSQHDLWPGPGAMLAGHDALVVTERGAEWIPPLLLERFSSCRWVGSVTNPWRGGYRLLDCDGYDGGPLGPLQPGADWGRR
jgi:hypothetical protein